MPKDRPAKGGAKSIYIPQGEYGVSDDPDTFFTTVLGSCISTCLRDPKTGVGGINHFMLPGGGESDGAGVMYGVNSMELLINGLLGKGASRGRLEAKVFGGAGILGISKQIGDANAAMAKEFLSKEGIPIQSISVGGRDARRIQYWPATGRARQQIIDAAKAPEAMEPPAPAPKRADEDIEFF
ncbi:MAG: chemotaxis protein CheD [Pseudomonadota bacterium]